MTEAERDAVLRKLIFEVSEVRRLLVEMSTSGSSAPRSVPGSISSTPVKSLSSRSAQAGSARPLLSDEKKQALTNSLAEPNSALKV